MRAAEVALVERAQEDGLVEALELAQRERRGERLKPSGRVADLRLQAAHAGRG